MRSPAAAEPQDRDSGLGQPITPRTDYLAIPMSVSLRPSVIVRTFDEEQHIGRLLTGIHHQTIGDPEIIVVDSGSTDRTVDIARSFSAKIVTIDPADFSFGRSLNRGCSEASGDILVFISAHCWPTYDDWLERLLEPFADPEVAIVYGKQRGNDTTRFSEHQIFRQWFPDQKDSDQTHPFCNNANCAVRRSMWSERHYDETLTGLEDIAWARDTLAGGHRIVYAPAAEVVHVHDETPTRIHHRYRREAIAFKRIYPQEVFTFVDFLRLTFASIWGDLKEARASNESLRHAVGIFVFRIMQYSGTYRGFSQHGPIQSELKRKLYYPHPPRDASAHTDPSSAGNPIGYLDLPRINR